jgi:hypothetical protein
VEAALVRLANEETKRLEQEEARAARESNPAGGDY